MRVTSTPRAARNPVRLSNRSSAASSGSLASAASERRSAAAASGSPPMARKRWISAPISCGRPEPAPIAACSRKRSAISPTERPPTVRMPAIDSRSVTSARAAFGIGAGERREHALIFRPLLGGAQRQPFEIVREVALAVEVLHQPPLPDRREFERGDQRGIKPDVAGLRLRRGHAVVARGLETEREHLGVGRRGVRPAERFDAGLQEFAGSRRRCGPRRCPRRGTPDRDSSSRRPCRRQRGQVVARHRDRQIGPQAELAALRVGGEIHPLADVLARQIEERLGRLQDRRIDARIAGPLERGEQRVRRRIARDAVRTDRRAGHSGSNGLIARRALGARSSMVPAAGSTPNR